MSENAQGLTLGGGCFWCVEAIYQEVRGVLSAVSGYSGGASANPTYQEVCSGTSGHAEVLQISFHPAIISYEELLYIFWRTHDPTTLNRQGADTGTQYRSVIFYHDETQRQQAEKSRSETDVSTLWPDPIITEISPLNTFYLAEDQHQNYYRLNGSQPYCTMIIDPKVQKFRASFQEHLRN